MDQENLWNRLIRYQMYNLDAGGYKGALNLINNKHVFFPNL